MTTAAKPTTLPEWPTNSDGKLDYYDGPSIAEAAFARLRAARPYMHHTGSCTWQLRASAGCVCGLDTLLADLEPPT